MTQAKIPGENPFLTESQDGSQQKKESPGLALTMEIYETFPNSFHLFSDPTLGRDILVSKKPNPTDKDFLIMTSQGIFTTMLGLEKNPVNYFADGHIEGPNSINTKIRELIRGQNILRERVATDAEELTLPPESRTYNIEKLEPDKFLTLTWLNMKTPRAIRWVAETCQAAVQEPDFLDQKPENLKDLLTQAI